MEILKDRYTITELSKQLEVTDHALRYYEKEFKLKIPRDKRGRRYYTPDLANVMFQIKAMRKEGLQIKAIKKIFNSDDVLNDPPPVILNNKVSSQTLADINNQNPVRYAYNKDIKQFFEDFKQQINDNVSKEVQSVKSQLSEEIYKTKLELGACVENSARKVEEKLEKHFENVDRSITDWRKRKKKSSIKKTFYRLFR